MVLKSYLTFKLQLPKQEKKLLERRPAHFEQKIKQAADQKQTFFEVGLTSYF